jgi:hypothetical protein
MRMMRLAAVILLCSPALAAAAPIFSTGPWSITGEWSIDDGRAYDASIFPNAGVAVSNGSLNVGPGGNLTYVSGFSPAASLTMSGGIVQHGISFNGGNLNISGGQSTGSDGSAFGDDAVGVFQAMARISGGTFTGGNSPGQAGSAVVASAGTADGKPASSTVDISGGTFIGGTGSGGYYGGTTGYSLLSIGDTTVTGGHFLSPIAINGAYGGVTDVLGSRLSFKNNILSGTLRNGDAIDSPVFLSAATAVVSADGSEVKFVPASRDSAPPSPAPPPAPPPIPEPGSAVVFLSMACLLAGRNLHRWRIS